MIYIFKILLTFNNKSTISVYPLHEAINKAVQPFESIINKIDLFDNIY